MILCNGEIAATYKLSEISVECNEIFDEPDAATIGELYAGSTSIPYTTVTSIHYQTLSKKDTTSKNNVNNFSVRSLQGLLLLFLDKCDDLINKNEEFYNPNIKKLLTTINGMPRQFFAAGLQARDIYPELKKYFYKEHYNVTWEEFLTTKFGLWIDTCLSTDNALHDSSRAVEKSGILFQIEKSAESSDSDLTRHVFRLKDALAHLAVSNPSSILTIEQ